MLVYSGITGNGGTGLGHHRLQHGHVGAPAVVLQALVQALRGLVRLHRAADLLRPDDPDPQGRRRRRSSFMAHVQESRYLEAVFCRVLD